MVRPPSRAVPSRATPRRPVLYQLCRAGEVFEVGDGPVPLGSAPLVIGRGAIDRTDAGGGTVLVDDPWMSSRHAQVSPVERGPVERSPERAGTGAARGREAGRYVVEDLGSTNGILVNGVATRRAPLLHGDLLETGRTFWIYLEEAAADPLLAEPYELGGVSTWTPALARQLADLLPRVPGAEHVLLSGPPGAGKGFLARTIHVVSGRAGRLVHLDCRERKAKRLLVDLFGDGKRPGRLKDADGGTLFLENVDALPLEVQDRLVATLARGSFLPVPPQTGAGAPRPRAEPVVLGARVVAAMSGDVEEAVAAGTVRLGFVDVFRGLHVRLPALAQRLPDLGLLLDDFLARARGAPAISRDACRAVFRHPFRQNVRAMGRVIEAAASLAAVADPKAAGGQAGTVEVMHLPVEVVGEQLRQLLRARGADAGDHTSEMPPVTTGPEEHVYEVDVDATDPKKARPPMPRGGPPPNHRPPSFSQLQTDDEVVVDAERVAAALKAAHGNVSAAARSLGRPRALVLRWMREFGIDPAHHR